MSKATHMLAMAGMALAASAAFGAAPAMAAPAAPEATTVSAQGAGVRAHGLAGDHIAGYYRTLGSCERAGRVGEFFGRWNAYHCNRVGWGHRRGWWILSVDDNWHNGHWGDHNGNGHWGDHNGDGHWGDHNGDGHWGHH